ncbi:MAG: hypothetical protein IJQ76_10385 [Prevotella sp.]|nr:hypothetical protein [Prevotella sp.]
MKRKLNLLGFALLLASMVTNLFAQGTWSAPVIPGQDPRSLDANTIVYVYNIEADAILTRGMNWLTMAIADRPEGGITLSLLPVRR